jgi:hypothetical protein
MPRLNDRRRQILTTSEYRGRVKPTAATVNERCDIKFLSVSRMDSGIFRLARLSDDREGTLDERRKCSGFHTSEEIIVGPPHPHPLPSGRGNFGAP